MDRIWAPWRMKYLETKAKKGCIFCRGRNKNCGSYVIFSTKYSLSMLNTFPYNNGHIMVSPLRHVKELSQLREPEIIDLFKSLEKSKLLLDKVLKPHGYNIGINISRIAGAGIPGHLHIHIVPRWKGDTNFMPVIYGTRVISQSLEGLCKKLKDVQSKID